MGFLDLFRKKKEEIAIEKEPEPILQELESERKLIEHECESCKKQIGHDRYKKVQGKYYHKSCWKKYVKNIKRMGLV